MIAGRGNTPPKTRAPLKTFNDGNSARGSRGAVEHALSLGAAIRLRTEELRFREVEEKKKGKRAEAGKDGEKVEPSTADTWRLHRSIQVMCRPPDDGTGKRERGPAVCGCGYASVAEDFVSLHVRSIGSRTKAFVTGTFRCDSPWLCPVCSKRAAAKRQTRVQQVVDATLKRGGLFAHVVLTVRHSRDQALADLKQAVAESSRAARMGRAWKALQTQMQALGVLSAPEVTYSRRHGWHYHVHLGIPVLTNDPERAREGCNELVSRYLSELEKRGYSGTWAGQKVTIAEYASEAAAYIGKGLTWELTGGGATKLKTRTAGSLMPFEIAKLAADGDENMRALWLEYADVMPGTRSCVVTPAIAKALNIQVDEDCAEPDGEGTENVDADKVGELGTIIWNNLLRHGVVPKLFDTIESGPKSDWPKIKAWAETVSAEVAPALRPSDIPVDDDADVPTGGPIRWRDAQRPLTKQEHATRIALQSVSSVPARNFIEGELQMMQRDSQKFGGASPPEAAEVIAALIRESSRSTGISRALEEPNVFARMEGEECGKVALASHVLRAPQNELSAARWD